MLASASGRPEASPTATNRMCARRGVLTPDLPRIKREAWLLPIDRRSSSDRRTVAFPRQCGGSQDATLRDADELVPGDFATPSARNKRPQRDGSAVSCAARRREPG